MKYNQFKEFEKINSEQFKVVKVITLHFKLKTTNMECYYILGM